MACKAALFRDEEAFMEVCAAKDPAKAKKIGRGVRDFDQERWDAVIEEVAYEVVVQKFRAEPELRDLLLSTGNKIIAEAAPNDRIWGIGFGSSDQRVQDPELWEGRNILGFALMQARDVLAAEAANEAPRAEEARAERIERERAERTEEARAERKKKKKRWGSDAGLPGREERSGSSGTGKD